VPVVTGSLPKEGLYEFPLKLFEFPVPFEMDFCRGLMSWLFVVGVQNLPGLLVRLWLRRVRVPSVTVRTASRSLVPDPKAC
jgi:hypothetical protein